jgi:hypothetical protein
MMIGTVMITAADLLRVELAKTSRNGVWLGLDSTASGSPRQKIIVTIIKKPITPLMAYESKSEYGTVRDASRAFSAVQCQKSVKFSFKTPLSSLMCTALS